MTSCYQKTYPEHLYRVEIPPGKGGMGLCAGVWINSKGNIADAAPVLRWAVGKPLLALRMWADKQGGSVEGPL